MTERKPKPRSITSWTATDCPGQNGSSYTLQKLKVSWGPSIDKALTTVDREKMLEVLTDRYGITMIEAAE